MLILGGQWMGVGGSMKGRGISGGFKTWEDGDKGENDAVLRDRRFLALTFDRAAFDFPDPDSAPLLAVRLADRSVHTFG